MCFTLRWFNRADVRRMQARAVCDTKNVIDRMLVDKQHVLRSRIFAGRLGWDVNVQDGRERDQYGTLRPT